MSAPKVVTVPGKKQNLSEAFPLIQRGFDDQFRHYLYGLKPQFQYSEYFEPLFDDLIEFATRRAKRVRPLLLILSHNVFRKEGPQDVSEILKDRSLMRAAMSIELLHAFILIHDDVIDRSELRRHLPTYHKMIEDRLTGTIGRARSGQNVSVVIGDMVFSLSLQTLLETDFEPGTRQEAMRRLLRYANDTGAGEVLDILLSVKHLDHVREAEIRQTYRLKTTRYTFECPLVIGATLAGATEQQAEELRKISEPLGMAFQLENDLNEFEQEERSFQSDLLESKKTLLILKAYELACDSERAFMNSCFEAPMLNDAMLFRLQEIILTSGAYHQLRQEVEALFAESDRLLGASCLAEPQKQALRDFIRFLKLQTARQSRSARIIRKDG